MASDIIHVPHSSPNQSSGRWFSARSLTRTTITNFRMCSQFQKETLHPAAPPPSGPLPGSRDAPAAGLSGPGRTPCVLAGLAHLCCRLIPPHRMVGRCLDGPHCLSGRQRPDPAVVHVWAATNTAVRIVRVHVRVQASVWTRTTRSPGYVPRSDVAATKGNCFHGD